jgi:hypothetical protein
MTASGEGITCIEAINRCFQRIPEMNDIEKGVALLLSERIL